MGRGAAHRGLPLGWHRGGLDGWRPSQGGAGSGEPDSQGGCSSWQDVYNYEIMPEGLSEEQQRLVLGAQGQLWSEYIPTSEHLEYMAHPRSMALAEISWTPKAQIR